MKFTFYKTSGIDGEKIIEVNTLLELLKLVDNSSAGEIIIGITNPIYVNAPHYYIEDYDDCREQYKRGKQTMATIDYGTLIIKDGKVLNEDGDLFPDLVLGEYTVRCYKWTLTIFKTNDKENKEVYWFDDTRYSYYLDTALGKIKIRTLSRNHCGRYITKIGGYTIIFGYGIDPDKRKGYQKYVMNNYGFDKREKRIVSKYLWGEENE